jgi:hypothetical protein
MDGGTAVDAPAADATRPTSFTLLSAQPLRAVAAQDGDGAWQTLSHKDGAYRFEVFTGRYRLVYVCLTTAAGEILQATLEELSSLGERCGDGPAPQVTGAIRGLPDLTPVHVVIGRHGQNYHAYPQVSETSYTLAVPPGNYDLIATADVRLEPSRILIKRDLTISGPTTLDLDFSVGALQPRLTPVTYKDGSPVEGTPTGSYLRTRRGALIAYSGDFGKVELLDPAVLDGDLQAVNVMTVDQLNRRRGVMLPVIDAVPPIELPPLVPFTARRFPDTGTGARVRIALEAPPTATYYGVELQWHPGGPEWTARVGAAWIGGATTFELPDIAALPGFQAAWAPPRQGSFNVGLTAYVSNRSMQRTLEDEGAPGQAGDTFSYTDTTVDAPFVTQ